MFRTYVWAAAALLLAGCNDQPSTYEEAVSAYGQNRVADAEAALRKLAGDPKLGPGDRGRAHRELARITWLIDGNATAALAALARAEATGEDACDSAQLRARILQGADPAQLLRGADRLAARCPDPSEASVIQLHAAQAALDLASTDPAARSTALATAKTALAAMHPDARGGLRGSAVALQLGLVTGDSQAAHQAWKDFFWLTDIDVPQAMRHAYRATGPIFTAALAPGASAQQRLQLVDLLVRGGFATAAQRFAASSGLPGQAADHPLWRKATAYFEARRELEATILASNRRVARGGRPVDLEDATDKARAKLVRAAGLRGDEERILLAAYGLAGQVGDTEGYSSVHYGHAVQNERRTIEQYGHRANVAFLALDNMIANGFTSWLWDGSAAVGGWASPGPVIVQVRSEWTSGPLTAWSIFSGGPGGQRISARQAERAAADLAVLKKTPVAYLAGLSDRLLMQVAQQIGARARQLAGNGGDLKREFLAEFWRATFEQSILGHEGRHALDKKLVRGLARLSDSNLEYRAKLSEVALADYPRLAFNNINEPSVGSSTGHGKANSKMLEGYAGWIANNSAQVRGFDPKTPALAQLDKLSDEQMRSIARGLDPIAQRR